MSQGPMTSSDSSAPLARSWTDPSPVGWFSLSASTGGEKEVMSVGGLASRGQRTSRRRLTPYGRKGTPHSGFPAFRWTRRTKLSSPINFHSAISPTTRQHLYHHWLSTLFGLGLSSLLFQLLHDWVLKTPNMNVMKTVQLH